MGLRAAPLWLLAALAWSVHAAPLCAVQSAPLEQEQTLHAWAQALHAKVHAQLGAPSERDTWTRPDSAGANRGQDYPDGAGLAHIDPARASDLAAWQAASISSDWRARRLALMALLRVPAWDLDGAQETFLECVAAGLNDAHPSVVEAALHVGERHALFDDWIARGLGPRLRALGDEASPGVREALVRVAARLAAPVTQVERASSPAVQALALTERLAILASMLHDTDMAVRAEARAALWLADLPSRAALAMDQGDPGAATNAALDAWFDARIALLQALVEACTVQTSAGTDASESASDEALRVQRALGELVASLELLSRGVGELDFNRRLVEWGADVARQLAKQTDSSALIWRALFHAVVVVRGGTADVDVLAKGYLQWSFENSDIDLDLDAWMYIDRLFEHAVERPGLPLGVALLQHFFATMRETNRMDAAHIESLNSLLDGLQNAHPSGELVRVLIGGMEPDGFPIALIDWPVRGLVWSDLEALPDSLWDPSGTQLGMLLGLDHALARGHIDRPDAATEARLFEWMEARSVLAYVDANGLLSKRGLELYFDVFRALCAARFERNGELLPRGWSDAERFFGVLSTSYREVWRHSSGVRLDMLMRLPRVPEMEAFADILILVGDTGGMTAGYRADCIELLGACRGVGRVADALERWLAEEWPGDDVTELSRFDELELAGLIRAITSNGAAMESAAALESSARGRDWAEALLEIALTRGPEGGVANNLARSALGGLSLYPDGLRDGATRLLTGWQDGRQGWLEARAEAALMVLAADTPWRAEQAELCDVARQFLMTECARFEADFVERTAAALGRETTTETLLALTAELERRVGQHGGLGGVGPFVDALVDRGLRVGELVVDAGASDAHGKSTGARAGDRQQDLARIEAALVAAARTAKVMEWRGLALSGLSRLVERQSGARFETSLALLEALAFQEPGESGEVSLDSTKASLDRLSLAQLSIDERAFLRDRAQESLARVLPRVQQTEPERAAAWTAALAAAALPRVQAVTIEDLAARWRGEEPRGSEFVTHTAEAIFAALDEPANQRAFLDAEPAWWATDALFLRRLSSIASDTGTSHAAALERDLLHQAWLGQAGLSISEGEIAVDLLARQLLAARERGAWREVGLIADELAYRWRRTGIWERTSNEAYWVGGLLGTYLPKEGRDPRARVEALRYQAAAHLAEQRGIDPMPYVSRAAELIGASSRAAADQAEL